MNYLLTTAFEKYAREISVRNFTEIALTANHRTPTPFILSKIKKLAFGIMLIFIGNTLPSSVYGANVANINRSAAMEKQRNLNKTNLARVRHFDKKAKKSGLLKLDAMPPSPRRRTHPALANPELK
jgi:hypothetical protein